MIVEIEYADKDELVEYADNTFEQLELAYVITIHKSQGSESPIVMMPIHPTQEMMLDMNLVYTGYTRAKQIAIMFGDDQPAALDRPLQELVQQPHKSAPPYRSVAACLSGRLARCQSRVNIRAHD